MIIIRAKDEIKKIKKSGQILAKVKNEIKDILKIGITGLELDSYAEKRIKDLGGSPSFKGYNGFPNTLCISVNEHLIHGIPNNKTFKNGDIVKVDIGVIYKGYHSDSAFTTGLGSLNKKDKLIIQIVEEAFNKGIHAIKPGSRVGDICYSIGSFIKSNGLFVPKYFTGHGIGSKLHEEPFIPNFGEPGTGPLLKNGMVLAIEPMIMQETDELVTLADKWTVKSLSNKNTYHFEQTIVIENWNANILTEEKIDGIKCN